MRIGSNGYAVLDDCLNESPVRAIGLNAARMFPHRWLDGARDTPIIRDYPQEAVTAYIIFGCNTRKGQYISAKTLCQMEIER